MNIIKPLKKLSLSTKIQLIIAVVLTVALVITIPTYSWFNYEKRVAELAKIKSPDNLYINAAHKEDIIHLDMSSIDLNQKYTTTEQYETGEVDGEGNPVMGSRDVKHSITAQSFVFSVSGEWVNSFTLQMEHTTNNPFTYTFYEGKVYASKDAMEAEHSDCNTRNATDGSLPYVEYIATNEYDAEELRKVAGYPNIPTNEFSETDAQGIKSYFNQITTGQTYYIWYGGTDSQLIKNKNNDTGRYLNMAAGQRYADSSSNLTIKSYEEDQNRNRYALPVYWQLKNIGAGVTKGSSFYKTYIVKISWTGQNMDAYKKETDLFYISAFVN